MARCKRANQKELRLKNPGLRVLVRVSIFAVFLLLLGLGISIIEENVFSPDPVGKLFAKSVVPRDFSQLIVMVVFSSVLV